MAESADTITKSSIRTGVGMRDDPCSFPCHLYMLYLNEKGEIFACPRARKNTFIGYVYDQGIHRRIIDYVPHACQCKICTLREANREEKAHGVVNFNLEIGGECNGACIFCFQKPLSTFRKPYPYYKELESLLLDMSQVRTATVFGGEVTVQRKTLRLISLLSKVNKTAVTIVTNGDIHRGRYKSLCDVMGGFQVSIYGFSKESVRLISNLNFARIKAFCEHISENHHSLDVKFVLSPLVVHELLPFLEWSLSLNVKHVMIYYAILPVNDYETTGRRDVSSFDDLNSSYWVPILSRLSRAVKAFFSRNSVFIREKGVNYIVNHEVLNLLKIPADFLCALGIPQEKSISISCKAWKSVLAAKSNPQGT